jgi:glycerophosphoryl diester phosphodiesterase
MKKIQVTIISTVLFFISCASSKQNKNPRWHMSTDYTYGELIMNNKFDKQGHRGCRGLYPENTIPAMIHALDLGVTTLEMDISFTKDSVAILSHEPFFNHEITTKADGSFIEEKEEKDYNIFNITFTETEKYDVGLKPHPRFPQQKKMAVHKPSLAAVFDSVKAYMQTHKRPFPYFNIETKTTPLTDNTYHPAPAVFVDMLMKVIKEKQMEQWVMIQSFDVRTLQYLHKNYPTIPAVLLIEDYDKRSLEDQLSQLGFTPNVYSPHYSLVTKELLGKCHSQKIKVIPWTVNEKEKIEELKSMGVDGIISDYPNLFND